MLVDEQELRRICDEMETSFKKINPTPCLTFQVLLSDSLTYSPKSIDELLKEENSRNRAITGIEITGGAVEARISVRIGLEAHGGSSVTVEGDDRQWVYVTLSAMEDRIKRLRQWHPKSRVWGTGAFIGGLACLIWVMFQATEKYPAQLLATAP